MKEAQRIREVLKEFYTVIKRMDEYLRFVLLTGISKFSKVGVFSGLNSLLDLTMGSGFEFKLDESEAEAFKQIKQMEYFERYKLKEKEIHLIGVRFETEKRGIGGWQVERST